MKFMWPALGLVPKGFEYVFTTPGYGVPRGIKDGYQWASDNGGYKGFDSSKFLSHLNKLLPYKQQCIFVCAPDKLCDCTETISMFYKYQPLIKDWPLAFVAQDGQEMLDFPDISMWNTLFIGGSTNWKDSSGSIECIKRAQSIGKNIHIGRVNRYKRYKLFSGINGSDKFTCDGTRLRYERDKTIRDWLSYMRKDIRDNEEYQIHLPLLIGSYTS